MNILLIIIALLIASLSDTICRAEDIQPTVKVKSLAASEITPELLNRLKSICGGGTPPVSANDIALILGAIEHPDLEVRKWGCLAVERTSGREMFDASSAKHAIGIIMPRLRSANNESAGGDVRAVAALTRSSCRFFAKETLQELSKTAIALLADEDIEKRQRGVEIMYPIIPHLSAEQVDEAALALLAAGRRPTVEKFLDPNGKEAPSASLRALNGVEMALARCGGCRDITLAKEIAEHLLHAFHDKRIGAGARQAIINGLAYPLASRLQGDVRKQIIDTIIASTADDSLTYTHFSGIPSPVRHSGTEALGLVIHLIDSEVIHLLDSDMLKKLEDAMLGAVDFIWGSDSDVAEYRSRIAKVLQAIKLRRKDLKQEENMQNKNR